MVITIASMEVMNHRHLTAHVVALNWAQMVSHARKMCVYENHWCVTVILIVSMAMMKMRSNVAAKQHARQTSFNAVIRSDASQQHLYVTTILIVAINRTRSYATNVPIFNVKINGASPLISYATA